MAKRKTSTSNASEAQVTDTPVAESLAEGNVGAAASQAAEQVQEKAGALVDQIKDQVTSQLTTQKDRAAGGLETAALLIRQAGEQVRQQGQAPIAQYIETAADRVEEFSGTLRERDVTQLVEETEQLARRRPGLFLGGSMALGFLATRFFKSPSQTQEKQPEGSSSGSEGTGYGQGSSYDQGTGYGEMPGYGSATGYGSTAGYDTTSTYGGSAGYGGTEDYSETTGDVATTGYGESLGADVDTSAPSYVETTVESMVVAVPLEDDEMADLSAAPSLSEVMVEARLEGAPLSPADYSPNADYAGGADAASDTEER